MDPLNEDFLNEIQINEDKIFQLKVQTNAIIATNKDKAIKIKQRIEYIQSYIFSQFATPVPRDLKISIGGYSLDWSSFTIHQYNEHINKNNWVPFQRSWGNFTKSMFIKINDKVYDLATGFPSYWLTSNFEELLVDGIEDYKIHDKILKEQEEEKRKRLFEEKARRTLEAKRIQEEKDLQLKQKREKEKNAIEQIKNMLDKEWADELENILISRGVK